MTTRSIFWQDRLAPVSVVDPVYMTPPDAAAFEAWQVLNLIASTISPDSSPGSDLEEAMAVVWPDAPGDDAAIANMRAGYAGDVYRHAFVARIASHGNQGTLVPGMGLMLDLCAMRAMNDGLMRKGLPEPDALVGPCWHYALKDIIAAAPRQSFVDDLARGGVSHAGYLALGDVFTAVGQEQRDLGTLVSIITAHAAEAPILYPALLARDWLDAMNRYLPETIVPGQIIKDGLARLAEGPHGHALAHEFPPVSVLVVAAAHKLGQQGPDKPVIAPPRPFAA